MRENRGRQPVKIVRNRLVADSGTPLPYRRSPNQSPGLEPAYVVVHYTAGASAASSIDWLTNPAARAGAHVVVARDGSARKSLDNRALGPHFPFGVKVV